MVVHRAGATAAAGHATPAGDAGVQRAARRAQRLGEVEPSLLGRALRGLPRVLLLAVLHRAALDQATRGRGRLGSRDRRRDAGRDAARAAAPGRGERARAPVADRLSDARDPRQRRRHTPLRIRCAARGAASGALAVLEGSGHLLHARDPVKVNLLLRDFIEAGVAAPLGARQVAAEARALHLVADRARPRAARRGDRGRAAQARHPTSRSTGWPSTR